MARRDDKIKTITREEAESYAREMTALDKVRSSKIEARKKLGFGKKGWEMSVILGKTPRVSPCQFYGPLVNVLRKKHYRYRTFQEGCGGRDQRPFRGSLRPGYDLVCLLLDYEPMEFRIHVRRIGARLDTDDLARIALGRFSEPDIWRHGHGVSTIYLSARNVMTGREDEVQEILAEVKDKGLKEVGGAEMPHEVKQRRGSG